MGLLWSGHPMGKILGRKTIFFDCLPAPRDRPAKAIPWSPGSVCGWQTDKTQIPPCSSQGVKGDASCWHGRPPVLGMVAPSNRSRVHWVHLRIPPAKIRQAEPGSPTACDWTQFRRFLGRSPASSWVWSPAGSWVRSPVALQLVEGVCGAKGPRKKTACLHSLRP